MNKKYFTLVLILLLFISGCNAISSTNKSINSSKGNKVQSNAKIPTKAEVITTSHNLEELIAVPDEIVYYHKGTKLIINKGDVKFANIIKLTKIRVASATGMYSKALIQSEVETQKQNNDVVEFVYSTEIERNWNLKLKLEGDKGFPIKFAYKSLLFPLTGDWKNMLIVLPIQIGPLEPLGSANDLLNYLNN